MLDYKFHKQIFERKVKKISVICFIKCQITKIPSQVVFIYGSIPLDG